MLIICTTNSGLVEVLYLQSSCDGMLYGLNADYLPNSVIVERFSNCSNVNATGRKTTALSSSSSNQIVIAPRMINDEGQ